MASNQRHRDNYNIAGKKESTENISWGKKQQKVPQLISERRLLPHLKVCLKLRNSRGIHETYDVGNPWRIYSVLL